jgi:hypothetical protein
MVDLAPVQLPLLLLLLFAAQHSSSARLQQQESIVTPNAQSVVANPHFTGLQQWSSPQNAQTADSIATRSVGLAETRGLCGLFTFVLSDAGTGFEVLVDRVRCTARSRAIVGAAVESAFAARTSGLQSGYGSDVGSATALSDATWRNISYEGDLLAFWGLSVASAGAQVSLLRGGTFACCVSWDGVGTTYAVDVCAFRRLYFSLSIRITRLSF